MLRSSSSQDGPWKLFILTLLSVLSICQALIQLQCKRGMANFKSPRSIERNKKKSKINENLCDAVYGSLRRLWRAREEVLKAPRIGSPSLAWSKGARFISTARVIMTWLEYSPFRFNSLFENNIYSTTWRSTTQRRRSALQFPKNTVADHVGSQQLKNKLLAVADRSSRIVDRAQSTF